MVMPRGVAMVGAFALSFAIYLIPLYHLHAGWIPLGVSLAGVDDLSALALAWIAFTLVLQGAGFLLFFWVFTWPRWPRIVTLFLAAPVFVAAANMGLLYALPLALLVGVDGTPETGTLDRECAVADATLAQVDAGVELALVRAGEAWISTGTDGARALLRMPGCVVTPLDTPRQGATLDVVAPGGHLLRRDSGDSLRYFNPVSGSSEPLSAPPDTRYWTPILTDDGRALVWMDRAPGQGAPGAHRIRVRHLADGTETTVPLDLPPAAQFDIIGARSADGPFTLARFRNEIVAVDINGAVTRGPVSPKDIYDARWGFRWLDSGWIAWDGYREEGRSRIVWDLPAGTGEWLVPRGRSIDALGVSSDGRLVALSFSTDISISTAKSAVVVFRTGDGDEIYRRYYPALTRTRLTFLGADHLAITRLEDGKASVDVFRIPRSGD